METTSNKEIAKTFKAYLTGKGLSNSSVEAAYNTTCYFLNWCDDERIEAEQATYRDLLSYVQTLQKKGIKQVTVKKNLNAISHYYKWLIKQNIRDNNPTSGMKVLGIKRKTLYHLFSRQEMEQLYHNYNQQNTSAASKSQRKVLIGLAIFQGLSTHDMQLLTEQDLKLKEGIIHVPGSRNSNERDLKLEAAQIMDLMEYQTKSRAALLKEKGEEIKALNEGKLFIGTLSRGEISLSNHLTELGHELRKLNPKYKNIKQLRTSVITHWLKSYNLRQVQYMAGHRYVSTTESYQSNLIEDLQTDIDKYDPLG